MTIERDIPALLATLFARRHLAHEWRKGRDCVSNAMICVEAQTGIDHLADMPDWTTRAQALAVARSLGGLRKAMDDRFNRIAPSMTHRGDIAGLADKTFGVRLMVVEGETLVGPGDHGLERLPRKAMTIAWSALP